MWDEKHVQEYEYWHATKAGEFALRQEKRLLESMVSGWPRRGRSLLEVGCGPGYFLEMLWEAGFDVTGLDRSTAMLEAAHGRLGHKAELNVGNGEHLPYEDNRFDYVVLLASLEFMEDPETALEEAFRVAARGVLVGFLNRWSLYYLTRGRPCLKKSDTDKSGTLRKANWFSPLKLRSMLREVVGDKPMTMRSVLAGPVFSWRDFLPCALCNGWISPLPFGGYAAIRVDLVNIAPVTPIMAKAEAVKTAPTA
ncbi:class I SAM-dependent methyltransferase [Oleidesulfovibrio sp.]|uniref:class I SAM-dependent methyltransferase n=1 Tax=Oleidesulfovibrio sp. TaxID=2909707 RepID=UPI003A84914E